jgi:predicted nucleic acid-binding protein
MQYLLDTNAWIIYLKDPNSSIRAKLASISPQQVVTCSAVLSELLHGAEKYGSINDLPPSRMSRHWSQGVSCDV